MASRREARQWAMQILFQLDFDAQDLDTVIAGFWAEKPMDKGCEKFTEELVRGTVANITQIDTLISKYAEHWELHRMGRVDLSVMRLAMYEMLFRKDIPPIVSINEAVDMAKQFSSEESGRFVNGILDRARKDLDRPSREAVRE